MHPEVTFAATGAFANQKIGVVSETLADFPLAECVEQTPLTERLRRVRLFHCFGQIGLSPSLHRNNQHE